MENSSEWRTAYHEGDQEMVMLLEVMKDVQRVTLMMTMTTAMVLSVFILFYFIFIFPTLAGRPICPEATMSVLGWRMRLTTSSSWPEKKRCSLASTL
jgi:hypothetical protein